MSRKQPQYKHLKSCSNTKASLKTFLVEMKVPSYDPSFSSISYKSVLQQAFATKSILNLH